MESGFTGSPHSPALISSVAFGKTLSQFPVQLTRRGKWDLCNIRHVSYIILVLLFATVLIEVPLTLKEKVSGIT